MELFKTRNEQELFSVDYYMLKDKLYITRSNYLNMVKRHRYNNSFIQFVLIYYSLFLIVSSITAKYFLFYNSILDSYFNIIVSIIVLVVSLINGNARYGARISTIEKCILELNDLETILIENKCKDVKVLHKKYYSIIKDVELRTESDYLETVNLGKVYSTDWVNKEQQNFLDHKSKKIIMLNKVVNFCRASILAFPVIVITLCILVK